MNDKEIYLLLNGWRKVGLFKKGFQKLIAGQLVSLPLDKAYNLQVGLNKPKQEPASPVHYC